jgi:hypothetical protein
VPLRTPEYEVRGPTVVNLSKGASARVDADAITTPSVPRLTHIYNGSTFCFCSVLHTFQKSCFEWLNLQSLIGKYCMRSEWLS